MRRKFKGSTLVSPLHEADGLFGFVADFVMLPLPSVSCVSWSGVAQLPCVVPFFFLVVGLSPAFAQYR